MPTETERKFLLRDDSWRQNIASSHHLCQAYAYFQDRPGYSFRIRIADRQAFLTVKGPVTGFSRPEFEYEIPQEDAQILIQDLCSGGIIEKIRHRLCFGGHEWEIDEFLGHNAGLIVAEIELLFPEEEFERPGWLGKEVTGDVRYYNSMLLKQPFDQWSKE